MRRWRTLFSVAWAVWVLDLATKIWAVNNLSYKSNIKVIGEFFQLTFVRNSGAAFSFAAGATIFFIYLWFDCDERNLVLLTSDHIPRLGCCFGIGSRWNSRKYGGSNIPGTRRITWPCY